MSSTFEELTDPSGRMRSGFFRQFSQFIGGTLNNILKHLGSVERMMIFSKPSKPMSS